MGIKRSKIRKLHNSTHVIEVSSKDKISALPDDILSTILSFLPLKEVGRTSTVSRRWRYLWKAYAKFSRGMNFDVLTMRTDNYLNLKFDDHKDCENKDPLWSDRCHFARWVDRMMEVNYIKSDRVMDSFSLCFYLNNDFAQNIDEWINTAIHKGVRQNFKIDFSTFCASQYSSYEDLYTFPCSLFTREIGSVVKSLYLSTLKLGTLDFMCFHNLVDLHLEDVPIDAESITKLLTECRNLEKLSLIKLRYLSVDVLEISALNLKYLRVDRCFISNEINMNALNLTKFEYAGKAVKFSFLNIPPRWLSDVTIDFYGEKTTACLNYALGGLSKDIPNLESLFLTVTHQKDFSLRRHLLFSNLKKLLLKVIHPKGFLWGFVPLVLASPYLQRLELHLFMSAAESSSIPDHFSDTSHDRLEEITLTGFSCTFHEIEFVLYLLSSCKVLKKMTINCSSKGSLSACEKNKIEIATCSLLKKMIPCGVKFKFVVCTKKKNKKKKKMTSICGIPPICFY